ncbi:MAG: hypothetical protein ABJO01_06085 [Parasphingorhabdus sp.]|uniref:hypothetical protein n=1 Tax=Parasphingorhabdus sp. TaxID=2709688 RepID=UPI0032992AF1
MKQMFKILIALTVPLLLSACLLLPGKFEANLNILDGDRYEFAYVGQIQMSAPNDGKLSKPELVAIDPAQLKCRDRVYKSDGRINPITPVYGNEYDRYGKDANPDQDISTRSYDVVDRDCTEKEIEDRKAQAKRSYERKVRRYEEEVSMARAFFGGAIPGDDETMVKFAERLEKYRGWEKVEHAGGNIFNVEYKESGTIGNYFSFPIMPDAQFQYPFFQLVRRADGAVELLTPGIAGQGGIFNLIMQKEAGGKAPKISDIDGLLTVETNGKVINNNSIDGFAENGDRKIMRWEIGKDVPMSQEGPRALIRF